MITTPHARPFAYPITQEYASLGLDPTKIEALYLFDTNGNLYDASGNQRHGDISASSGFDGVGRYGIGMPFDGIDDCVTTTSYTDLGNTNTEISVLMWIKTPSSGIGTFAGHSDNNPTVQLSWYMINAANSVSVTLSSDGVTTDKSYTGNINIEDSEWHQIGFVYDGNSSLAGTDGLLEVVLDGKFFPQGDLTKGADNSITTLHPSTADVSIGCRFIAGVASAFKLMDCDNVMIYSGILTSNQIQNLYNKGL